MPFAKTALLDMTGAAPSEGSSGENISHFTAVRMRLVGNGNLQMELFSQDDEQTQILVPFIMQASSRIQPTRLCNFIQQRALLEISTVEINEIFKINRIIVFVKEMFSSYPG